MRHETTNHYSLKAAKKNAKHLSPDHDCSFYMHDLGGNSLFKLGNAVCFDGRISRILGADQDEKSTELVMEWFKYDKSCDRVVAQLVDDLLVSLLSNEQKKKIRKRAFWINPKLVGSTNEGRIPLFLRNEP